MKNLIIRSAIAFTFATGVSAIAFASSDTAPSSTQVASAVKVSAEQFKKFEGNYQVKPGFVIAIFQENGKFLSQATGQQSFEIFADTANSFHATIADIKIDFSVGNDGMATHFTASQNGNAMPPAMRVK
jgi:uncharacterized protein YneR